jgi:hypothetical protein
MSGEPIIPAPTLDDYSELCTKHLCKWCGCCLPDTILGTDYPHPGGWPVRDLPGTYWLYKRCVRCEYEWALWKLGVPYPNNSNLVR